MKNTNNAARFGHQYLVSSLITGILALSTFNAHALGDEISLSKEQLLQQFNRMEKIQPTLYFENNTLRIFGENSTDLSREKAELLIAADIFKENFGSSPKLDVALMNNQMNLLQLDTSKVSKKYIGFMSYQGLQGLAHGTKTDEMTEKKLEKYNILAHEVCHKLLMNKLEDEGLKSESNGQLSYGHALLPDWFDEMAAIMCENRALTEMRLADDMESFIPFDEFFVMENPAFTSIKEQMNKLIAQKLKNDSDKNQTTIMVQKLDGNDEQLASRFYQQSALFHYFLTEKLGDQIFKRLTKQFVLKADVQAWLLEQLTLNNVTELNAMFKQFSQKDILSRK